MIMMVTQGHVNKHTTHMITMVIQEHEFIPDGGGEMVGRLTADSLPFDGGLVKLIPSYEQENKQKREKK